jgi:hypothetical protein
MFVGDQRIGVANSDRRSVRPREGLTFIRRQIPFTGEGSNDSGVREYGPRQQSEHVS